MRKSILLALLLSAVALGLSACDISALPYAAKVGNSTISTSRLNSVLDAVNTSASLQCVLGVEGESYKGVGTGNFSSTFTADQLSALIELQVEDTVIHKLGLVRSSFVSQLAATELASEYSSTNLGSCTPTGAAYVSSLPTAYANELVNNTEDQILLEAKVAGLTLSPGGVAAYQQSHAPQMTLSCISVIVLSSEAKAASLAQAIRKGASFASIAKADSTDAGSAADGGAITCIPSQPALVPDALVAPIGGDVASLPTGVVSSPLAFNSSWVLLEVTSREGLAPTIATDPVAEQAIFGATDVEAEALVARDASGIGVQVNPAYGTFNTHTGNTGAIIAPPKSPSDSFLLNSKALTPTSGG